MSGANNYIQLVGLDFDSIKQNLKQFLKSQDILKDVNYEGSAISTLLDILAYNTHYQGHYLNMVANEMFLDTALKRSSVVSHAKNLGYTPYSYSSPSAIVNISFNGMTSERMVMPKFTRFISNVYDGKNYTFVANEEHEVIRDEYSGNGILNNVVLVQGEPITYSFTFDSKTNPKGIFKIPDSTIDISSIKILVQKSASEISLSLYTSPDDLLSLNKDSEVYFIQESLDGYYELYFGDGIIGKKLNDGNIVYINYLSVSSTIANDINDFSLVDVVGSYTSTSVITVSPSTSGREKESISSIKYTAPKAYSAQHRAVTVNDYVALIQQNSGLFPVDAVNVWSGEENIPPIYGKIFVSIKPKGGYTLTLAQKNKIIQDIIKPIGVLTVEPVIVDTEYTYIKTVFNVLFDKNKTLLSNQQLKTLITSAVSSYTSNTLNTFNSTLSVSELTNRVGSVDTSIIANECVLTLQKRLLPKIQTSESYVVDFGVPIKRDILRKSVSMSPTIQQVDIATGSVIDNIFIEETPSSGSSIQSIKIISQGFNYTTVPTITIVGDGKGASAHAEILDGRISNIVIDNQGVGYTQAFVEISGGGGTLASAIAILDSQFGTLRSYYLFNNSKVILNPIFGTVDYLNGIVTIDNLDPYKINNPLQMLNINVVPDTTLISSGKNKIITMDLKDSTAIQINLKEK